jgi:GT2 family glycosyltransferase
VSTQTHAAGRLRAQAIPYPPQLSCSVVLCTRNRPEALERCLEALRRQSYQDFEVLVVDSAPETGDSQSIALRWGARYLRDGMGGLSRARNLAARACRSDILAFLDDDALPQPEWLAGLLDGFSDPAVSVVCGSIASYPAGTAPEPARASDTRRWQRRRVDRSTPNWFELANFGGLGDGGNMAFRRAAFQVWPGFDERLGRGAPVDCGEEHYAFFHLLERGASVVYAPEAVVLHPAPAGPDEIVRRHLADRKATVAYIALLLAEQPRYGLRVLKFLGEAFLGKRRAWRASSAAAGVPPVPRWRLWWAAFSGLLLFARLRLRPQRRFSSVPASATPQGSVGANTPGW